MINFQKFEYQPEVFKEAIIYIKNACGNSSFVNFYSIQNMLYFADFDHYELYEKPITGESYKRTHLGAKSLHLKKIYIKINNNNEFETHGGNFKYLIESEKQVLNKIIKEFKNKYNQKQRLIYFDMPFKATKSGKIIDYELVFYRNEKYSKRKYIG